MVSYHRLKVRDFRIPEFGNLLLTELNKYRSFRLIKVLANGETRAEFFNVTSEVFDDVYDLDYVVLGIENEKEVHQRSFICSRITDTGIVEFIKPELHGIVAKIRIDIPPFSFKDAEKEGLTFKVGDYYHICVNRASKEESDQIERDFHDAWDD